jgi:hypothetical protein
LVSDTGADVDFGELVLSLVKADPLSYKNGLKL